MKCSFQIYVTIWYAEIDAHDLIWALLHFMDSNMNNLSHTLLNCISMSQYELHMSILTPLGVAACISYCHISKHSKSFVQRHHCDKHAQFNTMVHGSYFKIWHDNVLISEYESWSVHPPLWHTCELYHSVRYVVDSSIPEMQGYWCDSIYEILWDICC